MFVVGLGLPVTALTQARAHSARIAIVVFVPVVVLPALAWASSRLVSPGPLRDGVLSAGVAPTEVAAVALAALAGGSAALSATVLIGSTIGSVLLARGLPPPIRTSLLLPVAMRDFAIAAGIAAQAFGPEAAAPLGLYGVLVLLLGAAAARTTHIPDTPSPSP